MDARRGPFDEFAIATAVLTRLPVGAAAAEPGAVAAAGWAFPLVGAGIGLICALAFFVAGPLGVPNAPAALLAVAAGLLLTGAFHEDGLADTADGFGGGRTREEKLAIMRDSRHGTFFEMLPTVRQYAQSALYSQMNNTDLFTQVVTKPQPRITLRTDWRYVGLASSRDGWYYGSGATQQRGSLFGFATRPSFGARHLATIGDASIDYAIASHWSVNGYFAVGRAGGVRRPAPVDPGPGSGQPGRALAHR